MKIPIIDEKFKVIKQLWAYESHTIFRIIDRASWEKERGAFKQHEIRPKAVFFDDGQNLSWFDCDKDASGAAFWRCVICEKHFSV